jgi:hypothetical protein
VTAPFFRRRSGNSYFQIGCLTISAASFDVRGSLPRKNSKFSRYRPSICWYNFECGVTAVFPLKYIPQVFSMSTSRICGAVAATFFLFAIGRATMLTKHQLPLPKLPRYKFIGRRLHVRCAMAVPEIRLGSCRLLISFHTLLPSPKHRRRQLRRRRDGVGRKYTLKKPDEHVQQPHIWYDTVDHQIRRYQ